jgi:adenosylmethionine-8-amino-7-oxononanoate aminotransferase
VSDAIAKAYGGPMTGHTFTGHTACCAAGVAVQKIIHRDKLVERVKAYEPKLKKMIAEATQGIEAVGDIRGRGFFIGTELVSNRGTKKPFDGSLKLYMHIRQQALENGLICYPVGGNVDGINGDVVILAPPYNSTDAELEEMVSKMAKSVRQVLGAHGLA